MERKQIEKIKMDLSPEMLKSIESKRGSVCMREKDFIEIVTSQEEWSMEELENCLAMSTQDIQAQLYELEGEGKLVVVHAITYSRSDIPVYLPSTIETWKIKEITSDLYRPIERLDNNVAAFTLKRGETPKSIANSIIASIEDISNCF